MLLSKIFIPATSFFKALYTIKPSYDNVPNMSPTAT